MNIGDLTMDLVVNTGNLTQQLSSIKGAMIGALAGVITSAVGGQIDKLANEADRANKQFQIWEKTIDRFNVSNTEAGKTIDFLNSKFGVQKDVIRDAATMMLRNGASLEQVKYAMVTAGASAGAASFDISSAFKNVSTALVTGRSELLETSGLVTNLGPVYDQYARSVGKTADELTSQQKIQAGLTAIMQESKYEIADMDTIMGGLAGTNARLGTAQSELGKVIGGLFVPTVTQAKEEITGVINETIEWVNTNKTVLFPSIQAGYDIISGIGMLAGSVVGKTLMAVYTLYQAIKMSIESAAKGISNSFKVIGDSWDSVREGNFKEAYKTATGIKDAFSSGFKGLDNNLLKMYENSFKGLNALGKEAETRVGRGFGSAWSLIQGEIPKVTAETKKGTGATKDYLAEIEALLKKWGQSGDAAGKDTEAKKRLREALTAAKNELATLTTKYELQIITEAQYRKGLSDLIGKYDGLRSKQKEGSDQWTTYAAIVKGARDALTDLNKTSVETQKRLAELRLDDVRKRMLEDMIPEELERALEQIPERLRKAVSPEEIDSILAWERMLTDRLAEFEAAGREAGNAMLDGARGAFADGKDTFLNGPLGITLTDLKTRFGDISEQQVPLVIQAITDLMAGGYITDPSGGIKAWLTDLQTKLDESKQAAQDLVSALEGSQKAFSDRQASQQETDWQKSVKGATLPQLKGYRSLLQGQLAEQTALPPMDQDPEAINQLQKQLDFVNGLITDRIQKGIDDLKTSLEKLGKDRQAAYKDALEMASIGVDTPTSTPPGDTQGFDTLLPPLRDITSLVEQYQTVFKDDPFGLQNALSDLLEASDEATPGIDKLITALETVNKLIYDNQLQMASSGGDLATPFKAFGEADYLDTRERLLSLTDIVAGLQTELKDKPEALADALTELAASTPEGTEGLQELHQALLDVLKLVNDPAHREKLGQSFIDSLIGSENDWKDIKLVDDLEGVFEKLVSAGFGDTKIARAMSDAIEKWRKEIGEAPTEGQSFTDFALQGVTDFEAAVTEAQTALTNLLASYNGQADKSGLLKDLQALEEEFNRMGLAGSTVMDNLQSALGDVTSEMMKPGYGEGVAQALLDNLFGQGFEFGEQSEEALIRAWNLLASKALGDTRVGQALWDAMTSAIDASSGADAAESLKEQFWRQLSEINLSDPTALSDLIDGINGTINQMRDQGMDVSGFTAIWEGYLKQIRAVADGQQYLEGVLTGGIPQWEQYARQLDDLARAASGDVRTALQTMANDIRNAGEASDQAKEAAKKQEEALMKLEKRLRSISDLLKKMGSAVGGDLGANFTGLGNLLSSGLDIGLDVAKGDWFSAVVKGLGVIVDAFGGFQRAAEEARKANEDFLKQFSLIDGSAFGGAYTRSRGFFGDLFGGGPEVVKWANELAVTIAKALEGGVKSGLGSGIKNFMDGSGNILDGLKEGIRGAIINAITEAVIQGAIVKGALGGLLTQLTGALASGNNGVAASIVGQIQGVLPGLAATLETTLAPLKGALGSSPSLSVPESTMGALPAGMSSAISTAQMEQIALFGQHVASFGRALQRGMTITIQQDGTDYTSRLALT